MYTFYCKPPGSSSLAVIWWTFFCDISFHATSKSSGVSFKSISNVHCASLTFGHLEPGRRTWSFLPTEHGAKHGDVWCLCMKHLPNFVPKHCLNDKCIHLKVVCLGFDYHQQYEEMFCSYVHPFMGAWRVGYQRDNRVDQVEWSVVKSILLRYFESNSHSLRSFDTPLEWWYGGMVIWPKPNVPCCIALDFSHEFCP